MTTTILRRRFLVGAIASLFTPLRVLPRDLPIPTPTGWVHIVDYSSWAAELAAPHQAEGPIFPAYIGSYDGFRIIESPLR